MNQILKEKRAIKVSNVGKIKADYDMKYKFKETD